VSEAQFQLVRGAGFALAAVLATALQRLAPHARLRGSRGVNLGLWAVNLVVIGTVCGACACTVARWAAAAGIGAMTVAPPPAWAAVPVTIGALDLVSYLWHRANHRVAFLWRFHRVHHSDRAFTASTAVRFHPGELLLSLPVRLAAVAALGPPVEAVVAFEVVFTVANLVEHGDIALPGALERALGRACVTPALHRLHHTKHGPERDRNFGTVFSVWDRLLGTWAAADPSVRVETGLAGLDHVLTWFGALMLPVSRQRL
jgi:sterol desaturase/sphingolipid hydroxylase (fatty acid hydroxylase superfamily)